MPEPFNITPDDLGRYVRRTSTGEVGQISRDPGNGWLYPRALQIYEWNRYANDLEYVVVIPDDAHAAAFRAGQERMRERVAHRAEATDVIHGRKVAHGIAALIQELPLEEPE